MGMARYDIMLVELVLFVRVASRKLGGPMQMVYGNSSGGTDMRLMAGERIDGLEIF